MTAGYNQRNLEKNLIQCFIHHESHMKSSRIEPGSSQWEARIEPPEQWQIFYLNSLLLKFRPFVCDVCLSVCALTIEMVAEILGDGKCLLHKLQFDQFHINSNMWQASNVNMMGRISSDLCCICNPVYFIHLRWEHS
jgi:hypothetical protein